MPVPTFLERQAMRNQALGQRDHHFKPAQQPGLQATRARSSQKIDEKTAAWHNTKPAVDFADRASKAGIRMNLIDVDPTFNVSPSHMKQEARSDRAQAGRVPLYSHVDASSPAECATSGANRPVNSGAPQENIGQLWPTLTPAHDTSPWTSKYQSVSSVSASVWASSPTICKDRKDLVTTPKALPLSRASPVTYNNEKSNDDWLKWPNSSVHPVTPAGGITRAEQATNEPQVSSHDTQPKAPPTLAMVLASISSSRKDLSKPSSDVETVPATTSHQGPAQTLKSSASQLVAQPETSVNLSCKNELFQRLKRAIDEHEAAVQRSHESGQTFRGLIKELVEHVTDLTTKVAVLEIEPNEEFKKTVSDKVAVSNLGGTPQNNGESLEHDPVAVHGRGKNNYLFDDGFREAKEASARASALSQKHESLQNDSRAPIAASSKKGPEMWNAPTGPKKHTKISPQAVNAGVQQGDQQRSVSGPAKHASEIVLPGAFNVWIQIDRNLRISLKIDNTMSVMFVILQACKKANITPSDRLSLSHNGEDFSVNWAISECDLREGDVLHLRP